MTGRERVRRCLEFDDPDRLPRDLWSLPIAWIEHSDTAMEAFVRRWTTDFARPQIANPAFGALLDGEAYAVGTFRDEWGCEFENIQAGVIGEVKRPPLDDWSKMEDLRSPIEALEVDIDEINDQCAASDKFMMADICPRPFERMQFLRGTEDLYMDLAEGRSEVHELLRIVDEMNRRELELWAGTDVDGMMFMDDWGSQHGLLISPASWRKMFKPIYAEYVRIAHDAGKKILMHSDGHIFEIYEDLIEIGVDAINSQLFCMDIEEIGRRFAGRITFWGEIDRQHILPRGSIDECRAAVARVVENLYRPQGGMIAQFEFGPGAKIENAQAVFEAWEELTSG